MSFQSLHYPDDGVAVPPSALRQLLPVDVVVSEILDISREFPLHPQERHCVESAAPKRMREFSAGRHCARSALREVGIENFPLLIGADRSPCWPPTIVGSITHAGGYCGVALGARAKFVGIGIDAEVVTDVGKTLGREYSDSWTQIFTIEEMEWLNCLPQSERVGMLAVMFSAKEAFYKCQYSVTRQVMDFNAATVRPDCQCFVIEPRDPPLRNRRQYQGRFALWGEFALATLVMTAA